MTIQSLLKQTGEWLRGAGPHSDIVLSSRIRLARNLDAFPFSHWASKRQDKEIFSLIAESMKSVKQMKKSSTFHMSELSDLDRHFLLERHLISREHVLRTESKAVVISEKEIVSLMVNEEDHLRLQVMQSGLSLQDAWRIADQIDTALSKQLSFAYDKDWGFLTACPTNTGTGMRSSVMLHLPALVTTKQMNQVIQAVNKLGMVVRGFYGEGTEAEGNLFQISNQITLGQTESEILDGIERLIIQIVGHEENARKQLLKQNKDQLHDKIWRAYGALKHARIVSSKETTELLSTVRLGVDLGVIADVDRKILNELFLLTQPAHLQRIENKLLAQSQRDVKRANLIRSRLES